MPAAGQLWPSSIQTIIQFKINSGVSTEKIIQFNSQEIIAIIALILVESKKCPKSAQKMPKKKIKGAFNQKLKIWIQYTIH